MKKFVESTMSIIKKDFLIITKIVQQNFKSILFWFWLFLIIYFFIKIWIFVVIYIVGTNIYSLFQLFFNDHVFIRIKNNKISLAHSYYLINNIEMLCQKFSTQKVISTLPYIVFRFLFSILFGVSFKIIKTSLRFFEISMHEYKHNQMKFKKIKIWKYFFGNICSKLIAQEFIGKEPTLNNNDKLMFRGKVITVHIFHVYENIQ